MESVNAYAVVDNITYPLLFKIFKPRSRLQPGDVYKTRAQRWKFCKLKEWKFQIELVLADSGERRDSRIATLKIPFIVAIRSNHGVLIAPGQKVLQPSRGHIPSVVSSSAGNTLYSAHCLWQSSFTSLLRASAN